MTNFGVLFRRPPCAALLPYVESLWVWREDAGAPRLKRERRLPGGTMQLVFRLSPSLRILTDESDRVGSTLGPSLIGGIRTQSYSCAVVQPEHAVAATLRAGAGGLLLGAPADTLASRHTSLADLWGAEAELARERLAGEPTPARQLDVLEAILLTRAVRARQPSALIRAALTRLAHGASIARVVEASNLSHRHFSTEFERAVGLTPKRYSRVLRFTRLLEAIHREQPPSWAELALASGYSDQAHFSRDFHAFSGVPPSTYARLRLQYANHLPLPQVEFVQDRIEPARHNQGEEHA